METVWRVPRVCFLQPLLAAFLLVLSGRALAAQVGALVGRVIGDSTHAPLPGAEVILPSLKRSTRTNASGQFYFAAVPVGHYDVHVRTLGYAQLRDTVTVSEGAELSREYWLRAVTISLPEVGVTTTLIDRKLADFADRRRMGIGSFLDSADIAKAHGSRLSDKLTRLSGLLVMRGPFSSVVIASTRGQQSVLMQGARCPAAIVLDGAYVGNSSAFNINEVQPTEVAAVEWYRGPSEIPARFNVTRNACGLLIIWTK